MHDRRSHAVVIFDSDGKQVFIDHHVENLFFRCLLRNLEIEILGFVRFLRFLRFRRLLGFLGILGSCCGFGFKRCCDQIFIDRSLPVLLVVVLERFVYAAQVDAHSLGLNRELRVHVQWRVDIGRYVSLVLFLGIEDPDP